MSFRNKIFFAGFLLLLPFLTGCANVRSTSSFPRTMAKGFIPFLNRSVSVRGVDSNVLTGLAFTHIRVPLSEDLVNNPVIVVHTEGKIIQVKEPVSGYGFYAEWDSNAIGDIAQRYGLKEVYFADIEIFSILSIYTHMKVHIYGK